MHVAAILLICSSAVVLAGCVAANPDTISATPTPTFTYQALDCGSLAAEDAKVAEELGYAYYRQERRNGSDIAGAIFVGITPSGLGHADWAPQIAQMKGQKAAINQTMADKGCAQRPAEIDTSVPAKIRHRERMKAERADAAPN